MSRLKSQPAAWFISGLFIATGTVLGALALERFGGYVPCALCLEQRMPYAFGILFLAAASFFAARVVFYKSLPDQRASVMFGWLALLAFTVGSYLGARHAGMEWQFWAGPTDCATSLSGTFDPAALLEKIKATKAVSCTDPALRILGLSLAGWNAVVSLLLVILTAGGLRAFGAKDRSGDPEIR